MADSVERVLEFTCSPVEGAASPSINDDTLNCPAPRPSARTKFRPLNLLAWRPMPFAIAGVSTNAPRLDLPAAKRSLTKGGSGVESAPLSEAVGDSIRVRRCAPRKGLLGEGRNRLTLIQAAGPVGLVACDGGLDPACQCFLNQTRANRQLRVRGKISGRHSPGGGPGPSVEDL